MLRRYTFMFGVLLVVGCAMTLWLIENRHIHVHDLVTRISQTHQAELISDHSHDYINSAMDDDSHNSSTASTQKQVHSRDAYTYLPTHPRAETYGKRLHANMAVNVVEAGEQSRRIVYHGDVMAVSILHSNESFCTADPELHYILYVCSEAANVERRRFIRTTWGTGVSRMRGVKFRALFIFGQQETKELMETLRDEQATHGDVVIGDFVDAYENLTLKGMLAMKWVGTYCQQVRYLLKVDDDVVFDVYKLIDIVEDLILPSENPHRIVCIYTTGTYNPVIRSKKDKDDSKWYVPSHQMVGLTEYPPYCRGPLYGFTPAVAAALLDQAERSPLFFVEDVLFTGLFVPLITPLLNISYVDIAAKSSMWFGGKQTVEHILTRFQNGSLWVQHDIKDTDAMQAIWEGIVGGQENQTAEPKAV